MRGACFGHFMPVVREKIALNQRVPKELLYNFFFFKYQNSEARYKLEDPAMAAD